MVNGGQEVDRRRQAANHILSVIKIIIDYQKITKDIGQGRGPSKKKKYIDDNGDEK